MFEDDLKSLYEEKERLGYTWGDIARILNEKHHTNYSGDAYRKRFSRLRKRTDDSQISFLYGTADGVINTPPADSIIGTLNVEDELNSRVVLQR